MNKYQILKWAIIGLTITSRATSAYATFTQDYRYEIGSQLSQQASQTLISYGNQTWQKELSQQKPPNLTYQPESEWTLINYEDKVSCLF